jgi:hypothetical protein
MKYLSTGAFQKSEIYLWKISGGWWNVISHGPFDVQGESSQFKMQKAKLKMRQDAPPNNPNQARGARLPARGCFVTGRGAIFRDACSGRGCSGKSGVRPPQSKRPSHSIPFLGVSTQVVDISSNVAKSRVASMLIFRGLRRKQPFSTPFIALKCMIFRRLRKNWGKFLKLKKSG